MAPSLTFDHLLIAVSDLAAARSDFEAMGFTTFYGGKHADGRTENYLIAFSDGGYLELIGFIDTGEPVEPGGMHHLLFGPGEGMAGYALLSTDLGGDTAAMRERGLDMVGPITNSRLRPDGVEVAWAASVISGVPSPFFLEDVTPRSARVPPEYASHANGATGVSRLVVAVADLASAVDRYERIFGEKANPTDDIAGARAVNFVRGSTTLTLAEPEDADSALNEQLKARGDSPFQVQLSGLKPGFIDPDRLHGARIATDN